MNADVTPMNADERRYSGRRLQVGRSGNVSIGFDNPWRGSVMPLSAFIGVTSAFIGVPRLTPRGKQKPSAKESNRHVAIL
ncbi:MAG: hypothetical protein AB7P08_10005 [Burkholderiales bacterium]